MCKLNENGIKGTGTVRINRISKCPISLGAYDYQFDKENKIFLR